MLALEERRGAREQMLALEERVDEWSSSGGVEQQRRTN